LGLGEQKRGFALINGQRPGFYLFLPLHLDVAKALPPLEIESGYAPDNIPVVFNEHLCSLIWIMIEF